MFVMVDNHIISSAAFGEETVVVRAAVNPNHIKLLLHNTDRNKVEVYFSGDSWEEAPLLVSGSDARKLGWQFRSEEGDGLLPRVSTEVVSDVF